MADFQLLDSLEDVRTSDVFVGGRHVVADRRLKEPVTDPLKAESFANFVHVATLTQEDFGINAQAPAGGLRMKDITLSPTRMTTLATTYAEDRNGRSTAEAVPEEASTAGGAECERMEGRGG